MSYKLDNQAKRRLETLEQKMLQTCHECSRDLKLCPYCTEIYNKAYAAEESDEIFAQSRHNS